MKNNPPKDLLVSVGIPTYKNPKGLKTTLLCITNQTYKNIEIIISNNCSPDNQVDQIIEEFTKKDKRIRYYKQKKNKGAVYNFHYVLNKSKGKYFMWAADDDKWNPNFIETLKKALDKNPCHGVVMSSTVRIHNHGTPFDKILLTGKNNLTHLGYAAVLNKLLRGVRIHLFIYGLFRTSIIKKVMSRPFPTCIAGDRILVSELALMTHFYSVKDILFSKTIAKESTAIRYSDEKIGKEWKSSVKNLRFVITMINRLFTSPFIPLQRKLYTIPSMVLFIFIHIPSIIIDLIPFKKKITSFYRKLIIF